MVNDSTVVFNADPTTAKTDGEGILEPAMMSFM
jgi:hypothetical protein